jgi:hypothetical protein
LIIFVSSSKGAKIPARLTGPPLWSNSSVNKGMAMNFLVDLANATFLISYSVRDVLLLRIFAVIGGTLSPLDETFPDVDEDLPPLDDPAL